MHNPKLLFATIQKFLDHNKKTSDRNKTDFCQAIIFDNGGTEYFILFRMDGYYGQNDSNIIKYLLLPHLRNHDRFRIGWLEDFADIFGGEIRKDWHYTFYGIWATEPHDDPKNIFLDLSIVHGLFADATSYFSFEDADNLGIAAWGNFGEGPFYHHDTYYFYDDETKNHIEPLS